MKKIRVSAVRYINSYPFIIGLRDGEVASMIDLEVCHPSECADRVISGRSDLGLIPVAMLTQMPEWHLVGDYCLSTNGEVLTVLLVSNTPFDEVTTIFLDYRSRSSVALCRILAARSWRRQFRWLPAPEEFEVTALRYGEAAVMIGDRCFEYARLFPHRLDLGLEWKRFTGLPFVFACWISSRALPEQFIELFNRALGEGLERRNEAVTLLGEHAVASPEEVIDYLSNNIDFRLDERKREALSLFTDYIRELNITP